MDMFVDKLAQKLTAQEIIRANTAADTEELNRLRNQIAEYNDCLAKLQKLIDDGSEKLQAVQASGAELGSLMDENIGKIAESARQDVAELTGHLEDLEKRMGERLSSLGRIVGERFEDMDKSQDERLQQIEGGLEAKLQQVESGLEARLQQIEGGLEVKPDGQLEEKFNAVDENVHKECVKVYRNVQAVILEESEKQKNSISEAAAEMTAARKKVGAVLKVSVAALLFSLLGIVLQVLTMLNIIPF